MPVSFKYIESTDDLDFIFSESFVRPLVLLKHSSSCGISAHILHQLSGTLNCEINVVVVQTQRDLSNMIADRTGHRHHSPQLFVLIDGKPVYHATHYGIDPELVSINLLRPRNAANGGPRY